MSTQFADTSFFVAYVNPKDDRHSLAYEHMAQSAAPLVTTTWVLVELGNYLADGPNRDLFHTLVRRLRTQRRVTIVPADEASFERGLRLYAERSDKEWSVTDCISFVLMRERRIREALTTDHHFEQAGFTILLK